MSYAIEKGVLKKYFFVALVVLLIVFSYLILQPYFVALISAFILGFLIRPVHRYFAKGIGDVGAAWACIILLIVVIFLPLGILTGALAKEAYDYASSHDLSHVLTTVFGKIGLNLDARVLDALSGRVLNYLASLLQPLVSNTLSFVIVLFVMFFGLYFVLVRWKFLNDALKSFLPFKDKEEISKELADATREIVYGTFLIGLIEFVVALIGFYVLGISSPVLLAFLVFFTAFVPVLGPGFVWVPLAAYFLIVGNIYLTLGVVVLGIILGFGIDLVLRGILTGRKSRINPFIMLLGIFGGVPLFGLFGFVIGPLVLVYTIKILQEIVE